jgi:hypothetical protein
MACTVGVATVATGQATLDTAAACFAGGPLPQCKTFWITEVGYYHRAIGGGAIQDFPSGVFRRPDLDDHFKWELGRMSNRSQRSAVGGALFFGGGGSNWRFGVDGRYRRWLGGRSSLDLSAGPLGVVTRSPYSQPSTRGYGISGGVALGWNDWAALTVNADAVRGRGRNAGAVYGGVRLGSYPAMGATAAIAAYVGLLLLLLGGEGT